jgi:hypothetical protein
LFHDLDDALFHDLDDDGQRTELIKWLRFNHREEDHGVVIRP